MERDAHGHHITQLDTDCMDYDAQWHQSTQPDNRRTKIYVRIE